MTTKTDMNFSVHTTHGNSTLCSE